MSLWYLVKGEGFVDMDFQTAVGQHGGDMLHIFSIGMHQYMPVVFDVMFPGGLVGLLFLVGR